MKKHLSKIIVGLVAFSVGLFATYSFAWDYLKTLYPRYATHTAEKNSPYSILDGTLVRVEPYHASFQIPPGWLTPNPVPSPSKNLHLSYQDLNDLYWNDGRDAEEAQVINSTVPFENCAAHFGDKGWGNYLWNDLQGRLYVVDRMPEEISDSIERNGLPKALANFERASIVDGQYKAWSLRTLDILDAPSWSDFILGKRLDFYFQRFGDKTVVIVFLHADKFENEINLILDSFRWPEPDSQTRSG